MSKLLRSFYLWRMTVNKLTYFKNAFKLKDKLGDIPMVGLLTKDIFEDKMVVCIYTTTNGVWGPLQTYLETAKIESKSCHSLVRKYTSHNFDRGTVIVLDDSEESNQKFVELETLLHKYQPYVMTACVPGAVLVDSSNYARGKRIDLVLNENFYSDLSSLIDDTVKLF